MDKYFEKDIKNGYLEIQIKSKRYINEYISCLMIIKQSNKNDAFFELNVVLETNRFILKNCNNDEMGFIDFINNTFKIKRNNYDFFPINSACKIENDYNNYSYNLLGLYKRNIKKQSDENYFNIFVGNKTIKLNDEVEGSDDYCVYLDYLKKVSNYIRLKESNNVEMNINDIFLPNVTINNIYIAIFISYSFIYKGNEDKKELKHYYKTLNNYIIDKTSKVGNVYLKGTVEKIFLEGNRNINFFYEQDEVDGDDTKYFIRFCKEDNQNVISTSEIDLNTTNEIILKDLEINGKEENNINNYITNNGINMYNPCYNKENKKLIKMDFLSKENIKLDDIKIRQVIIKPFIIGKL